MCELWGSVTWNTAQLLYHKVWSVSVEALKEKDDYARPPPVWPCQWWFIVVSCCAVKTSEYGKRKGWNVFSHHHLFKAWSFSLFLTFSTLWKLNISFKYGVFFLSMFHENQNMIEHHEILFLYFCIWLELGPKWFIIAKRKWFFSNLDVNVAISAIGLGSSYFNDSLMMQKKKGKPVETRYVQNNIFLWMWASTSKRRIIVWKLIKPHIKCIISCRSKFRIFY